MSFVAISKVTYPPSLKKEVHTAGEKMLPVARRQPGLVRVALHLSAESNHTMMYWEWETQAQHEACMNSKDWMGVLEDYGAVFSQEGVEFSIETYERLG